MLICLLPTASAAMWAALGALIAGAVVVLPLFLFFPILPARIRLQKDRISHKKVTVLTFLSAAKLGPPFWLLALTLAVGYTFAYFAAYMFRVLMMDKQLLMFAFAMVAAICCPVVGLFVDKYTQPRTIKTRAMVLTGLACAATYAVFLLLLPTLQEKHWALWLIGLVVLSPAYGLVSVYTWPALAVLVPSELTGAATGIVVALKNICASVIFPPIIVSLFLHYVGGETSPFIADAHRKDFQFKSLPKTTQASAMKAVRAGLLMLVFMGLIFATAAAALHAIQRRRKESMPAAEKTHAQLRTRFASRYPTEPKAVLPFLRDIVS
ncbi:MAG: hypothetical protein MHM6MM_003372 [Cercozoa sp. M6MM]